MEKEKQFGGKLAGIGQFCFYAGLVLELLIVIIDKSAYINPVEGQLFRITFILFSDKGMLHQILVKRMALAARFFTFWPEAAICFQDVMKQYGL